NLDKLKKETTFPIRDKHFVWQIRDGHSGSWRCKIARCQANESDIFEPNDPTNGGMCYARGMSAINAVYRDGQGPEVFLKAYEIVGLGWMLKFIEWPVSKPAVDFGYRLP
ncbi:LOW QUALITY PROTEIN: hypothetical protein ACHAXM_004131, partial [Skeletonema potamos]